MHGLVRSLSDELKEQLSVAIDSPKMVTMSLTDRKKVIDDLLKKGEYENAFVKVCKAVDCSIV
jgi:hypothetical protein